MRNTIEHLLTQISDLSTEYRVYPASGGNYIVTIGGRGDKVTTPRQTVELLCAEILRLKGVE